jgi:ribosomal protein S18 acetylase RimI-like enzyme
MSTTSISFAELGDLDYLANKDGHVSYEVLREKLGRREILVLRHEGRRVGFLRFGLFWDEIPFMNLLWIEESSRGRGLGTRLIAFWENEMRKLDHDTAITSTLSSERAQHLYRRLGYRDCGSLIMPGEPLEILLSKKLT